MLLGKQCRMSGEIHPANYLFTISRGAFNKALGFGDLLPSIWPMLLAVPIILGTAIALLKKQER